MARSSGGPGGSSRKYHTSKRGRTPSHYPERLEARGLSKAPTMPSLAKLRERQSQEWWIQSHPAIRANLEAFREGGKKNEA